MNDLLSHYRIIAIPHDHNVQKFLNYSTRSVKLNYIFYVNHEYVIHTQLPMNTYQNAAINVIPDYPPHGVRRGQHRGFSIDLYPKGGAH